MKISNEAKVGGLVLATLIVAFGFAWTIGIHNPFGQSVQFYVTYNFAGGIELGSPVRVSGIKVGKVEKIEFFTPTTDHKIAHQEPGSDTQDAGSEIIPLKIKISVRKDAAKGVRADSRFYINLAGIIGERYIEITPGQASAEQIASGSVVAGVDPPRVDQLISQSFNLAGKLTDLLDENKGDITRSIELLYKMSNNLNKTLGWVDKSAIFKTNLSELVSNLISITGDIKSATGALNQEDTKKTIQLIHQLLWRLEPLDSKAVRAFFQKEGVKVQFF